MATIQVQIRRGIASAVAAFTGALGELIVDTTNNRVVVQDGSTVGGFPAALLSEVLTNASGPANRVMATPSGVTGPPSLRALAIADMPFATGAANLFLATPSGASGPPSLRALSFVDLPALPVTTYTTNATISAVGAHIALFAGITLTLPNPATWTDPPIVIKDGTGAISPNITLSGSVDGNAAGLVLRGRGNAVMLTPNGSTWAVIALVTAPSNPIVTKLLGGLALDLGPTFGIVTSGDDFGSVASLFADQIDLGSLSNPIAAQLLSGDLDLGTTIASVTTSDDFGSVTQTVLDTIILGTVP